MNRMSDLANSKKNQAASAAKRGNSNSSFSPAVIITLCVAVAILAAVIVWSVLAKQANSLENKIAMKIDETEISGLEYQFYYQNEISNFQNDYSSYLSILGVDFDEDLNSQTYWDGNQSWAEYFSSQAQDTLIESTLVYNKAIEEGYELSSDEISSVETDINTFTQAIKQLGYGADYYFEAIYGEGMTVAKYKDYVLRSTLTSKYLSDLLDTFEYTSEDCEEYYNEHKDSLDTASYRSYIFQYTVPDEVEEGDESYKDEAREAANAMLSAITDEASFEDYLNNNVLTDEEKEDVSTDFTLGTDVKVSSMNSDIAAWMSDSARVTGDTTVIEANNGFNVIYFIECGLDRYNAVNIRHIYIAAESSDEEDTEDETDPLEEAATEANRIYNEWLDGDATAESFSEFAVTYSDDSYAADGGVLSNVYKNYFAIDEINDWIFDSSRTDGDCVVINSDYGSHIIYFESTSDPYWEITVKNTLANEDYDAFITGLKTSAEILINEDVIDLIIK